MHRQNSLRAQTGRCALVTGGAGFIGSHVAENLVAAGLDVVVLDDLSGGYRENVPPGARLIVGSILDRELLKRLFDDSGVMFVYHFAAYAAECLSHHIRNFNYMNNVVGTANVITEAVRARVKAFVFASSAGVYGSSSVLLDEDTTPRPEDPYGIAKFAMELDLQAASRLFGLPYVIFRLHNVYGERQDLSDPYRNVVGIFMRQALSGQPMTIFGDGSQTRNFTYVADVVPHIVRAVNEEGALGQIINLGGTETHSVVDLSRMVARAAGVEWNVRHEPPRVEPHQLRLDHSRARQILGFSPKTSLSAGLERMITWANENLREPRPFRLMELETLLPPAWSLRGVEQH